MLKNKLITVSAMLVLVLSMILTVGCKEKGTSIDIKDDNLDVSQTYFKSHQVAKGEKGYYFFGDYGNYILYFDEVTKETIPLCSKAECVHDDEECMAYVKGSQFDFKIYYYSGKLYWLTNENGMVKLMECMADGSSRKIVGELYAYNDDANEVDLMFAGGYMYFSENGAALTDSERVVKLNRMSLTDGSTENVYEYTGINAAVQNIKAYSQKVYFTVMAVERTGEKTFESKGKGMYAYDTETKTIEMVVDDSVKDYCIDTKNKALYYYVYNKGLYVSKDGKTEQIHKATEQTGFCDLSFDGEYVYMDNDVWKGYSRYFMGLDYDVTRTVWIYDNGKLKTTINQEEENIVSFYNGDSEYGFALRMVERTGEVKMKGVSIFSKKEFFETGKISWIEGDYK